MGLFDLVKKKPTIRYICITFLFAAQSKAIASHIYLQNSLEIHSLEFYLE